MKLKRIIALFAVLVLMAGCKGETKPNNVSFSMEENGLFPFYAVDDEGILWKINNNGGVCLNDKVDYSLGGKSRFFTEMTEQDCLVYATDIRTENGNTFCTLKEQKSDSEPALIFENANFDSVKTDENGNILFLDKDKNLYFRRDQSLNTVAENVGQAEFAQGGTFVYRMNAKSENGKYPVYSFDGDNLTYLTDGDKILKSHDGNVYILSDIQNVQRRTATVQTATCSLFSDGEARFEIQNVILSQFDNGFCGNYLMAIDTEQTTLRYKVYYLDSADQPKEAISPITWGKALDTNVFFCEKEENGQNYSCLIKGSELKKLSIKYDSENTYNVNGKIVSLYNKKIYGVEDGNIISVTDEVNTFVNADGFFMYSAEKTPVYNLCIIPDEGGAVFINQVASLTVKKNGSNIFFLTGENGLCDLNVYNTVNKSITAITSNVDENIGFMCGDGIVTFAKKGEGTLFIVSTLKVVDCGIKISRFV